MDRDQTICIEKARISIKAILNAGVVEDEGWMKWADSILKSINPLLINNKKNRPNYYFIRRLYKKAERIRNGYISPEEKYLEMTQITMLNAAHDAVAAIQFAFDRDYERSKCFSQNVFTSISVAKSFMDKRENALKQKFINLEREN